MLLVVMCFVTSLAGSQYLLHRIDARALAIARDVAPRFQRIADMRRALLQTLAPENEYLARAVSSQETARGREQIDASLAHLRAELAAYRSLSPFSDEVAKVHAIDADVNQLDATLRQVADEAHAGEHAAALKSLSDVAQPLLLRIDATLESLRKLNEVRVRSDTEYIVNLRRNALAVAMALGLLSLGMAIGATALVLHGLRSRARLAAEPDRLLTERATELEFFAGRVAHDLRDPLNASGLRLAAIRHGSDLDPQLRTGLDKVTLQLERMRSAIDGLLEFARCGANPAPDARADLAAVLGDVLAAVLPAAEAAQAEVSVDTVPDVSLAIAPEALASVLSNLLGNAVKYVGEGRQLPHWICVRVSRRDRFARIEVEDNGPGLPPGSEQCVFEPFRRLASKQPGTGLGLATVKKIVEAYKGQVGVDAELGSGSNFWVEIPLSLEPAVIASQGPRATSARHGDTSRSITDGLLRSSRKHTPPAGTPAKRQGRKH